MSNPYAEFTQAKAFERIADAMERVADAAEAHNAADPLTMLAHLAEDGPMDPHAGRAESFASNGRIHMYALPDTDEWHIVARQDAGAESGYSVAIERA